MLAIHCMLFSNFSLLSISNYLSLGGVNRFGMKTEASGKIFESKWLTAGDVHSNESLAMVQPSNLGERDQYNYSIYQKQGNKKGLHTYLEWCEHFAWRQHRGKIKPSYFFYT